MILFIDACTRKASRTRELAEYLVGKLGGEAETVKLYDTELITVDEGYVNYRSESGVYGDFTDDSFDLAKQFAAADEIVIAAPFWDLSFPAVLKRYLELICVTNLTFRYSETGVPVGMCRAKKLYYVTTSGGEIFCPEFGFGYVSMLAKGFFGIGDCKMVSAERLDVDGVDVKAVMDDAKQRIDELV